MLCCGTRRICSSTRCICGLGHSPASLSIHTGYTLVNHPTLRVSSPPSISSSRPCPSNSTFTPLSPLHSQRLSTSAPTNTSCNWLPYAFTTSRTNCCVSSALNPTTATAPLSPRFSPPS